MQPSASGLCAASSTNQDGSLFLDRLQEALLSKAEATDADNGSSVVRNSQQKPSNTAAEMESVSSTSLSSYVQRASPNTAEATDAGNGTPFHDSLQQAVPKKTELDATDSDSPFGSLKKTPMPNKAEITDAEDINATSPASATEAKKDGRSEPAHADTSLASPSIDEVTPAPAKFEKKEKTRTGETKKIHAPEGNSATVTVETAESIPVIPATAITTVVVAPVLPSCNAAKTDGASSRVASPAINAIAPQTSDAASKSAAPISVVPTHSDTSPSMVAVSTSSESHLANADAAIPSAPSIATTALPTFPVMHATTAGVPPRHEEKSEAAPPVLTTPVGTEPKITVYEQQRANTLEVGVSETSLGVMRIRAEVNHDGSGVHTTLMASPPTMEHLTARASDLHSFLAEQNSPVRQISMESLRPAYGMGLSTNADASGQAPAQRERQNAGTAPRSGTGRSPLQAQDVEGLTHAAQEVAPSGMPLASSGGWVSIRV